jgi:predicted ribosomally synthesized peptide with SipW-like signal peptide
MIAAAPARGFSATRWLLLGMIALGLVSFQAGQGTLAFFTSSVASTGNLFTAGTLNLRLNSTATTGTITFDTATTSLKPSDTRYGYFTLANTDSGAVAATITALVRRVEGTDAAAAAALDRRLDFQVKEVSGTGAITDSATCASNWSAGTNTAVGLAAPFSSAPTATADRTAIANNADVSFFSSTFALAANATNRYCVRLAWVDATTASLDNAAKLGQNTYTITFNGQSS